MMSDRVEGCSSTVFGGLPPLQMQGRIEAEE